MTTVEACGSDRRSVPDSQQRPVFHNCFTAITIAASILVAFRHGVILLGPTRETQALLAHAMPLGIFILLSVSGYLLVGSWERRPRFGAFALARVVRIFPALIVVVVGTVFVLGLALTEGGRWNYLGSPLTYEYLLNILLNPHYSLVGVFVDNDVSQAVNGTLWSLPAQFACYFFIPLVGIVRAKWLRAGVWLILAAGSACVSTSLWAAETVVWGSQFSQIFHVWPSFFIAAALATVRIRVPAAAAVAATIAFALIVLRIPALLSPGYWVLIPVATIGFGSLNVAVLRGVGKWGNPAYGIFLVGFPIQQTLIHVWPELNGWASVLVMLMLSIACGYASSRFLERPLERRSKAWST